MSGIEGQVLRLDATHRVVDVLLPWFVNGTLESEERALVERHLGRLRTLPPRSGVVAGAAGGVRRRRGP